jgi:uncharacterized alpha-E superfamily protein
MLPQSDEPRRAGAPCWASPSCNTRSTRNTSSLEGRDVIDFMVRDPGNPSSIVACLTPARENAAPCAAR